MGHVEHYKKDACDIFQTDTYVCINIYTYMYIPPYV